jgi:hypothetical protein
VVRHSAEGTYAERGGPVLWAMNTMRGVQGSTRGLIFSRSLEAVSQRKHRELVEYLLGFYNRHLTRPR